MTEAEAGTGAGPEKPPQGWYVDPFGIHEHRWISQGRPTALVRDGRSESQDPPPDRPVPDGPLVPARAARPSASAPRDTATSVDAQGGPVARPGGRADAGGGHAVSSGVADPVPQGGTEARMRWPWSTRALGPLVSRPAAGTDVPTGEAGVAGGSDVGRPVEDVPVVPARILRARWITLAGAFVWTGLVCLEFFGTTTTVTTASGHHHSESLYASQSAGVVTFIAVLVACDVVTGVGLVRRVRARSERWGVAGAVCAGLLGVLGVLSLATVGLSMVLLAFLLYVVARPIRRPRPLPGERVTPVPGGPDKA